MFAAGLADWINQYIGAIKPEPLYEHYFSAAPLVEDDKFFFHISNSEKGIELVLSRLKVVEHIHLAGEENEKQKQFKEDLPLLLSFDLSRQQVLELFGKPKKKGGGNTNVLLGFKNTWDKFYFANYTLRVEYSKDETHIVLLTLGSLAVESASEN